MPLAAIGLVVHGKISGMCDCNVVDNLLGRVGLVGARVLYIIPHYLDFSTSPSRSQHEECF